MNILIADDIESNLYLLEMLLKGNGHNVEKAVNGEEALRKVLLGGVDLIISDILMPIMDGFTLCRQLKSDTRTCHIPIIIYTATYTSPQDEELAIKLGADRFILKPCEPEVFISVLNDVINEKKLNTVRHSEESQESEILKLYNERLILKLEKKMLQLEEEVEARTKAELCLINSEKRYRNLYNSIRDAILVVDVYGKITDCNIYFINLFGYELEEIKGKNKSIIFSEMSVGDNVRLLDSDCIEDHGLTTSIYLKKCGDTFLGEKSVFPLQDDDGNVIGFTCLIRDITEKKELEKKQKILEEQLYQSQKMESVGRFASSVAHDFNNLLAIILNYGEVLTYFSDISESYKEASNNICKAALKAKDLTRQLLAFSRKQVLEVVELDINEIVNSLDTLIGLSVGKDIIYNKNLFPESLIVKGDLTQIEQVFINMAVNARDAMNGKGNFSISTACYVVDNNSDMKNDLALGKYAVVSIADTGCGIDENTMKYIFEPFFTTKGKESGTGLGLAICYGIVKQHGGAIKVVSRLHEGTVFEVYLPLAC